VNQAQRIAEQIVRPMRIIPNEPWSDDVYTTDTTDDDGGSVGSVGSVGGNWSPPIPLGRDLSVPPFPVDALPDVIRQWVEAEAHFTQTPADLAAMLSLAVLAAVCAKGLEVEAMPGWREPVNLYVVVALDSGERKSAVFRDAVAPVEAYERVLIERTAPLIAERQQERRIAEAAVKRAESTAASESTAKAKVDALAALQILERIEVPTLPRLTADDTTLEALTTLLAEQGGRMAVMAAEGKLFDIAAGIYSSKGQPVNHDVLLKGHAGESLRVDRKNRPPEYVPNASVTLGLAVQPYKIDDLVKVHGAVDSGLVARMLFALPKSFIGWREQVTRPVPADVSDRYAELVLHLAEYFDALRAVNVPMVLRIDAGAFDLFTEFRREHETQLRPGARLSVIRAWASKLPGAVLRIAGLLEISKSTGDEMVSAATMVEALRIADYLTAHALAVYDRAGADRVTSAARKSIDFLVSHPDGFTEREFYKDRFAKEDALPVLRLLEEHQYIWRVQGERPGSKGGRPKSDSFEVNPFLLATKPTQPTEPPVSDPEAVSF
jgi:hypothetical protein